MSKQQEPMIESWITPSQKRIFSGDRKQPSIEKLTCMKNEPISFGLAFRSDYQKTPEEKIPYLPISVSVKSDGIKASVYKLGYVPCLAADCEDGSDTDGLCPDMLFERSPEPRVVAADIHLPYYEENEKHQLSVLCGTTSGAWITLNEDRREIPAGDHIVTVTITSLLSGKVVATHSLTLHVINASLPASDLIYTNWFHYDCLADLYSVELYSDEYFSILEKHIRNAVKNGMNTLLTPCFTPALDTPYGQERKNVQLVGVKRKNGTYRFDFSLLERFLRLALDCGITNIEHCHLFSQWGATSAINIYGEDAGEYRRLFSWEDPADGAEYSAFLDAYLPEFLAFSEKMGIRDRLVFHISDEPDIAHVEGYTRALAVVKKYLTGCTVCDALSHYEFYRQGLTQTPAVSTLFADDFYGKCDNFMLYYTGGKPDERLSNRLLTSSPQKTRALGVQLYKYRAKGFLHWGYNYYYGRMCHWVFDPAQNPYAYRNLPAVSYLVYPLFDRTVAPSIREMQMRDAMSDHGALKLLESLIGYESTMQICNEFFGEEISAFTLPKSGEQMLAFRELINCEIEKRIS